MRAVKWLIIIVFLTGSNLHFFRLGATSGVDKTIGLTNKCMRVVRDAKWVIEHLVDYNERLLIAKELSCKMMGDIERINREKQTR